MSSSLSSCQTYSSLSKGTHDHGLQISHLLPPLWEHPRMQIGLVVRILIDTHQLPCCLRYNLILWSSKHLLMVSHSPARAEYRAVSHTINETISLHQLFVLFSRLLLFTIFHQSICLEIQFSSPDQTYWDRHSFRLRKGCTRKSLTSSCSDYSSVCKYPHPGKTNIDILWYLFQYQRCWTHRWYHGGMLAYILYHKLGLTGYLYHINPCIPYQHIRENIK
jgi:hypothetical protein